jgi:hypothetical protein
MDKIDRSTTTGIRPYSSSTTAQSAKRSFGLARTMLSISIVVISVVLSACSSSASKLTPAVTPPPAIAPLATAAPTTASALTTTSVPQATAEPTMVPVPASAGGAQPAVVSTQLDPCQLINSQAASTLVGTTYGAGKEVTTHDNLKICTYGGQTTNIFTVEVVQAPDEATAQADKAQFLADLQSNLKNLTDQGLNVTQLPNFADGAVEANADVSAGGASLSGSAFGFLKGTVFFGFSDVAIGGKAPTDAAMQAEATTVLGELP